MSTRKRLLRWASGIMITLGAGHLSLLAVFAWADIVAWVDQGMWAAVPLALADGAADPAGESLQNQVTFWAGPGSFAVPLILLGCLVWHLAGRGVAVPAGIGWGLVVWCFIGGVLLVPSPYFAGAVAGALVVLAARQDDRSRADGDRENALT
ncbi:hypothetical protein GPZ77_32210 [Streptomyces sp. QHH-9511]|uniref:DUF6463 family protein n=1 Tax=Streptomyces sp. QHH-9511 TaxID=2684468 RepID=UPI0013171E5C|nr:DUF6463 family protein [Streptomyces sp. QHH-9511]QGZ52378.1 hypothetical protein GPZ77_32210 [Streptomyces sp. QHH-9511]